MPVKNNELNEGALDNIYILYIIYIKNYLKTLIYINMTRRSETIYIKLLWNNSYKYFSLNLVSY